LFELIVISHEPDPRLANQTVEEALLSWRRALQFVDRPHDGIDLPCETALVLRDYAAKRRPVRRADDEEVDVASELVFSRGVRAKEKRELDTAHRGERTAESFSEARCATDDLAHRRCELTVAR